MTTNKELLFNLVKKLESGEIVLKNNNDQFRQGSGDRDGCEVLYLVDTENNFLVNIGKRFNVVIGFMNYNEKWNKEFKENFYKEKGLDKCWVEDCPNKIYQTENDYKKVRVQCQDKHARMVCIECSKKLQEAKEEKVVCQECRFKWRKWEMLEKENGKWYCRRCAPHNIG